MPEVNGEFVKKRSLLFRKSVQNLWMDFNCFVHTDDVNNCRLHHIAFRDWDGVVWQ